MKHLAPTEIIYGNITITPTANGNATLRITKQDGTTEVLNVDTGNGRLGIGRSSPQDALDVAGTIRITHPTATANYWQISRENVATGDLMFSSTGTGRMRVGAGLRAGDTNSATSTLQSSGSFAAAISSKTTAYTLTTSDHTILVDATTGALTMTLPTAVGISGRMYVIKKMDGTANAVTIATTSSQTIDGVTTKAIGSQYTSITVQSDGANWVII